MVEKIFFDVDTQLDFMDSKWALPVPDAKKIIPNLRGLTDYAKEKGIVVAGSIDYHEGTKDYAHIETELKRNGGPFSDHCMKGTYGWLKIGATTLYPNHDVKGANSLGIFDEAFYVHNPPDTNSRNLKWLNNRVNQAIRLAKKEHQSKKPKGIYFHKQSFNVFDNPGFEKFLERVNVKEAVVYGVATDYCVKAAVLGMQERGVQTYVVTDAIKGITLDGEKQALEQMAVAGAKFVTTEQVLEGRVGGRR